MTLSLRPAALADIREGALWYEAREAGLGIAFVSAVQTQLTVIAAILRRWAAFFPRTAKVQSEALPLFDLLSGDRTGRMGGVRCSSSSTGPGCPSKPAVRSDRRLSPKTWRVRSSPTSWRSPHPDHQRRCLCIAPPLGAPGGGFVVFAPQADLPVFVDVRCDPDLIQAEPATQMGEREQGRAR